MSVILLIVFIYISYLIVRVGAIALEMTGMDRAKARFQALSAFTGTGFTTREAEAVINHPRRRKIVTYLMILGNAGIVTVIATFVVSLRPSGVFRPSLNLVIVAASLFVLYRITIQREFARKLTSKIRQALRKTLHFEKVHIEEILQQSEGYGVASVLIEKEATIAGLSLGQSGLRERDLMVLSIERDEEVIPVPKAQSKIHVGDRLICYGKLENLKGLFLDNITPSSNEQQGEQKGGGND
jgi:K+/H+ antiporter YhaU regulatory subunit KhtT